MALFDQPTQLDQGDPVLLEHLWKEKKWNKSPCLYYTYHFALN